MAGVMAKVRAEWQGPGGPGLTQLHVVNAGQDVLSPGEAQSAVSAVQAYFVDLDGTLPDDWTVQVDPVVDSYTIATGALFNSTTAPSTPSAVEGTAAGAWMGGAGLVTILNTGVIRNGRRVKGRLYFVPATAASFEPDGTPGPLTQTALQDAMGNLVSALNLGGLDLVVYSRPLANEPLSGVVSQVTGWVCPNRSAILRSRRD